MEFPTESFDIDCTTSFLSLSDINSHTDYKDTQFANYKLVNFGKSSDLQKRSEFASHLPETIQESSNLETVYKTVLAMVTY